MQVDLIESYGTDLSPVNAARVSFANESEWELEEQYGVGDDGAYSELIKKLSAKDTKLIHYLAKHKHTSCFEHQGATLRLKVPIFIARQIQRHRTFAYNEVSRRYVDSQPEFYWPDTWRARADNVKQGSSDEVITEFTEGGEVFDAKTYTSLLNHHVDETYQLLLRHNVAPELARMVLPQNMYTEFYMTGNLRNWAHFLKLRTDAHAQLEVQEVAQKIANHLWPLWPVSMSALMAYE